MVTMNDEKWRSFFRQAFRIGIFPFVGVAGVYLFRYVKSFIFEVLGLGGMDWIEYAKSASWFDVFVLGVSITIIFLAVVFYIFLGILFTRWFVGDELNEIRFGSRFKPILPYWGLSAIPLVFIFFFNLFILR